MSDLPTLDEAFPLPTAAEAFPDDLEPVPLLGKKPLHEYFQSGFTRGFGEQYPATKEIKDILTQSGLIGDIDKHEQSIVQDFNETILYGPVLAIDLAARSFMGLVSGVSDVAIGTGVPREFTPGAALEAFPFGVRGLTGVPRRPAIDLDAAADLGLLGRPRPAEVARQAFDVSQDVRPPEPVTPFVPNIHETARAIAPETFGRYDNLVETRQALRDWLDEQPGERRVNVGGVAVPEGAPLLETARQFDRLGEQATVDLAGQEIPLNARMLETARAVERDIAKIDKELVDVAPEVAKAYEEARAVEAGAPIPRERFTLDPGEVAQARKILQEEGRLTDARLNREFGISSDEARQIIAEVQPRPVVNLLQRAPTIARDVERQLVEVGRPRAEARANAALVQAHYETRAARFEGKLGTARELYEREGPTVTAGAGAQRGGIRLGERNVINLMEKSDASTFVHEIGHDWLEEIRRDAAHEAAPVDLQSDWASVKEWLGAGETLTRRQHEKFARGFERYLMEGQAPSARLATVFEKFREWLTKIYQTVSNLRAPITPEIRGVYDRLLTLPNNDPVIVAERPGARNFAEEHAVAARETPIEEAAAKASDMRRQRDIVGAAISRAVDDARRQARRGPERVNLPERSGEGGDATRRAGEAGPDVEIGDGRKGATGAVEAAPDGSFGPGQSELFDYKAGNIRTENLIASDDVRAAIKEAAGTEGGFLHARRGQLSDVETIQLANELGTSAKLLDRWAIGRAFNAEEIKWAQKLLVQSATDLVNAAGKAVDEAGVVAYAMARERLMMVQEVVSGVTAEAGRALRAFRQLEGSADLKNLSDSFFQNTLKLTSKQLLQEAARVRKLENSRAVNHLMSKGREATWSDMALEAYINALLSGPHTHVVNVVSNGLTALYSIPETAVAAGISRLRGDDAIAFAEVGDRFWGMLEGSVEGIRVAKNIALDEGKIPREGRTVDTYVRQAIPSKTVVIAGVPIRLGGAQVRLPGRFLAAQDEFFKAIAFQQEINVLARRAAREEGLTGAAQAARIVELKQHPTGAMLAAAKQFAEYQTFTNQLGRTGQAMLSFVNSHAAAKVFVPFLRTPINLLKYSVERTPLGLASNEVRARLQSDIPAVRDTQLARMALGSMVLIGSGWLALQGLISDGGPKSGGELETKRNTGWLPYSFRIGDMWYSYRRFDPLGNVIGLAADLTMIGKYVMGEDEVEFNKAAGMLALATWRNFGDKLTLRGVSGAFQAVTDWERSGQSFVRGMVSSVVPAAVGQFAQMEDPLMREARTIVDALKARVPYERETLQPRLDRWGQPITQTELGPIAARAVNADPVNQALADLGVNKAQPQRKINGGIELTPQQYHDYVAISGQMAKRMLDGIVTPGFRQLPKHVQVETINKVIDQTREMGRAYVTARSIGSPDDLVRQGMDNIMKQLH